jgi:glyoxylate reductase
MSQKVFVTRKIPENGINMLKENGYEVDINPNDRPLTKDELITNLKSKNYDAVITLLNDKIDKDVYDSAPTVKIFANYTIGFDNFDIEEGKKRGVYLTNVPGGGADRVAEHTWALILALSCRIAEADRFVRSGKYKGWDPMLLMGTRIKGKTIGLLGAGRIGTEVARIGAQGYGMRVIYNDVCRNEKIESLFNASYYSSAKDILVQSDIVSIHVPLMPTTHHLINSENIHFMKKTAFIINTSRGPVIDEQALVNALKNNVIAGAGLDVYENEPNLTQGLVDLENVVLTPHIASSTLESREEMSRVAALNVINTLCGCKPDCLIYN